jgi:hypothetical protein
MVNLGLIDVHGLSEEVEAGFSHQGGTAPSQTLSRDRAVGLSSHIFAALECVAPHIETFYDAHFQPYWIQIQRTIPGQVESGSAFQWHIDDNPRQVMKVFVYLNDVTEANGAFRALPYHDSQALLRGGFRSWTPELRQLGQSLVEDHLKRFPDSERVLEGGQGTVLCFDNNLIHKGTLPIEGYRHVIQIEVYPSRKSLDLDAVRKSLLSPMTRDYPSDPYFNDHGGLV